MAYRRSILMITILAAGWLGLPGCSTVGTAADRTGDVVGGAARGAGTGAGDVVEGTGDAIHDTAEKAKEEAR